MYTCIVMLQTFRITKSITFVVHLLSIIVVCINNFSLPNTLVVHVVVYPVEPFIAINLYQVPPLVPVDEKDEFLNTMFVFAGHKNERH